MRRLPLGFSLIEVLIVSLLSSFLILCLSVLLQTSLEHARSQQQQLGLQQHGWLVEQVLHNAIETAGFSAAYPADAVQWQQLTTSPYLRLYQQGTEPLPIILTSHWLKKLLPTSTVLESEYLDHAQFVQQADVNSIVLSYPPLAKVGARWLLTSTQAWQLLTVLSVSHQAHSQILFFNEPLAKELTQPLVAGPYKHVLWFVALDGEKDPYPLYGLYRWNLNNHNAPQEIVSGINQWHGVIKATKQGLTPLLDKQRDLIEWQVGLASGQQQMQQVLYVVNANSTVR